MNHSLDITLFLEAYSITPGLNLEMELGAVRLV